MRTWLVVMLGALVGTSTVYAHHSFAASYYESRSMTIEGELTMMEYRAPHAWVYVLAPHAITGETVTYSAEWNNPSRLDRDGIKADTLKPGDRLILTGAPGRNPRDLKMHLKKIERPADGWAWPAGRR
jgi:hypothetical protein